jgi:hypothetical protein
MQLYGLSQPGGHRPLDRRQIDPKAHPIGGRVVAIAMEQCLRQVQSPRDWRLEGIDDLERDGDGHHRGGRDRSADSLPLAPHPFDSMLRHDRVEPAAIHPQGGGSYDRAVGSQFIPLRA